MYEWILIVGMFIEGEAAKPSDMDISMIQGFTSKAKCQAAGDKLAEPMLRLGNKPRIKAGMPSNRGGIGTPNVWTECQMIEK